MFALGKAVVLKLKGLEMSLERVVTELLLWNLIGITTGLGPSEQRAFAVLDEAHRLQMNDDSATSRLLREGRKFGIGLILASQQFDDFPEIAFTNTASKLLFHFANPPRAVRRVIGHGETNSAGRMDVAASLTQLQRGYALFLTSGNICEVRVATLAERKATNL
jgi:DNA phosphorothioation-dependent restriction protein DptH